MSYNYGTTYYDYGYNNYKNYNNYNNYGGYMGGYNKRYNKAVYYDNYNKRPSGNKVNKLEEEQKKIIGVDNREKTNDVVPLKKDNTFESFNLRKELLKSLHENLFFKPSPVQEESIPSILMGDSILCRSKNGTGKTLAYALPLLNKIDENKKYIQGLVLVPTRELALQTSAFIMDLSKHIKGLRIVLSTGGTSLKNDIIRFRTTTHIVIGTPGRLLDLTSNGHCRLGNCYMIVMDEADKLLSADFIELINDIMKYIPPNVEDKKNRQLMLFSATFPHHIKEFVNKYMKDCKAKHLNLMNELTLIGINQYYTYLAEKEKVHCLNTLLKKLKIGQCIIFCKSVNRVELLARKITKLGFSCFYTHAKMQQSVRNRVFHEFRQESYNNQPKCRILICTDLITRGIDIQGVNVVINFDFPKAAETYLHRIGRAGRFGHRALAINFITDDDRKALYELERDLGTEIKPIPSEINAIDVSEYPVKNIQPLNTKTVTETKTKKAVKKNEKEKEHVAE